MATSIADLGAESARQHRDFGAGSLIVCDRLVRIYVAAGIEVQALPREMTEPLGLQDLVRLEAEPGHIGVWPDRREPGNLEESR